MLNSLVKGSEHERFVITSQAATYRNGTRGMPVLQSDEDIAEVARYAVFAGHLGLASRLDLTPPG